MIYIIVNAQNFKVGCPFKAKFALPWYTPASCCSKLNDVCLIFVDIKTRNAFKPFENTNLVLIVTRKQHLDTDLLQIPVETVIAIHLKTIHFNI